MKRRHQVKNEDLDELNEDAHLDELNEDADLDELLFHPRRSKRAATGTTSEKGKRSVAVQDKERPVTTLPDLLERNDLRRVARFVDPDVTLVLGGREFRTYRRMLKQRSVYLGTMLESDMREARLDRIELEDDTDPVIFAWLLKCMMENTLSRPSASQEADLRANSDLGALLYAADYYEVTCFDDELRLELARHLTVGNVLHMLDMAEEGNIRLAADLKEPCMTFIREHYVQVARKIRPERAPMILEIVLAKEVTAPNQGSHYAYSGLREQPPPSRDAHLKGLEARLAAKPSTMIGADDLTSLMLLADPDLTLVAGSKQLKTYRKVVALRSTALKQLLDETGVGPGAEVTVDAAMEGEDLESFEWVLDCMLRGRSGAWPSFMGSADVDTAHLFRLLRCLRHYGVTCGREDVVQLLKKCLSVDNIWHVKQQAVDSDDQGAVKLCNDYIAAHVKILAKKGERKEEVYSIARDYVKARRNAPALKVEK